MLIDIAQNSQVHHVHHVQKILSKMATMGVNNAFHVNIVMQVFSLFNLLFHKLLDNITNIRVQDPDGSVICTHVI